MTVLSWSSSLTLLKREKTDRENEVRVMSGGSSYYLNTLFDSMNLASRINLLILHFYKGIVVFLTAISHWFSMGATGFDMVSRIRGAGRGLLATLNRGKVKLIGKTNTQSAPALAMAA